MIGQKHLCVIDNDEVYQFTVKKTLELLGTPIRLSMFSDGLEAVGYLKNCCENPEDSPDVILLDLKMPMLDGWGFLREFSKFQDRLGRAVELYLITSSIDESDRQQSLSFPFVKGFISKPVSFQDLKAVFERIHLSDDLRGASNPQYNSAS